MTQPISTLSISRRAQRVEVSRTSAMRSIANELKAKGVAITNLAAGELCRDTAPAFKDAVREALDNGFNRYTDTVGVPLLRSRIADRLRAQTGSAYTGNNVAVTAGAKHALYNIMLTLFDEGDEVLLPAPCWSTFAEQIRLVGARPVLIDLRPYRFRLNADALRDAITPQTRCIVLNSPGNPTGQIVDATTVRAICELCLQTGVWMLLDSTYALYNYTGTPFPHPAAICPEILPRLVIADSFSKAYALAGWRIGFAAGPRDIIEAVKALQSHTTSNPSSLAQHAALAAFSPQADAFLEENRALLETNRRIGIEVLAECPILRTVVPDGGFYFYCDVEPAAFGKAARVQLSSPDDLAAHLLETAHVAVTPGSAFCSKRGFRISFSIETAEFRDGVMRLRDYLTSVA